jgi:hypothetical protein
MRTLKFKKKDKKKRRKIKMSKIRSIEDYFIEKFNEAQDEIEDLKIENNHLKEELEKKTESTEPIVLPELAVRYSTSFYSTDIKADNKDEWAKAVESNDFNEIIKMYRTKNSWNNMIRQQICNAIIKVANITFYCNIYINSDENRIYIYDNWLKWFEAEEEAQEEIRRLIRKRLSELEEEDVK